MRDKIIWATIGAGVAFFVQEIRWNSVLKEAERRINDQSIRLASLTERIEMLEPQDG